MASLPRVSSGAFRSGPESTVRSGPTPAGGAEAKQFFNCLDMTSSSPEALWLRKLKSNMVRVHIERCWYQRQFAKFH